jgi:NitT/TauT family transport system ATP-binding protein
MTEHREEHDAGLSDSTADGRAVVLRVTGLCKSFVQPGGHTLPVLNGVSFSVRKGEVSALLGPSGCGKTTLLNIVARLDRPDCGEVSYDANGLMYLFQQEALFPWKTVSQNIEFGLRMRGVGLEERRRRVDEWLGRVRLAGFGSYYPSQLSQGMRKRVALASAMAWEPQLLLMDEPFASLDMPTRIVIESDVSTILHEHGTTAVFVTHDFQEAAALADRVLVMSARPAQIVAEVRVPLPQPRRLVNLFRNEEFHSLVGELSEHLFAQVGQNEAVEGAEAEP